MTYKITFVLCLLTSMYSALAQPIKFSSRGIGGGGALFFPAINPANDNEFYISSDKSQLFHSTDFGDSYSQVHFTRLTVKNGSTYEFTNDSNIAYANYEGGNTNYPVKTIDGGNTWTMLPGFDPSLGGVYRMAANYDNPSQLVMNYFGDVVFSNDGGTTFQVVRHAANANAGLVMGGVFYDSSNIYIGTNEGLLVSADGGASFNILISTGIPAGKVIWSFAAGKASGTTRFMCIVADSAAVNNDRTPEQFTNFAKGVYGMDNLSGAWQPRMGGIDFSQSYVMYVGMARNNINTVYLGGGRNNFHWGPLVLKSTNGGNLWVEVFKTMSNQNIKTGWSGDGGDKVWSFGRTTFGITVAPNNASKVMFGDRRFVHLTSDGGTSWKQAYVNNADQHPASSNTPEDKSYHSIGLENTSCWQVTWQAPDTMLAAGSSFGSIRSLDSGASWSFKYSGPSASSLYRIVRANNGTLFVGGSEISDIYQGTRLIDAELDYQEGGRIYYSINNGGSWNTLQVFNHPVFWMAIDPNDQDRMYASVVDYSGGTGEGGIWTTAYLGALMPFTFTKLPNPPRTEGHPATVEVLNDGKVVCTYSGRINATGNFTPSSGVFLWDPVASQWSDVSDTGMHYWTKDIVIDPADLTQNTWYVGVFSGWGGSPNGKGGLYKTTDRGSTWTKLTGTQFDRVTSVTFNPANHNQAFLTTGSQGLWMSNDMNNTTPTWTHAASYPFRQPERVFFNPYDPNEVWVTSFGNGMKVGYMVEPNSITFVEKVQTFFVYPNPVTKKLQVNLLKTPVKPVHLSVLDIKGRVLDQKMVTTKITTFETSGYAPGLYMITDGENSLSFLKEQ